MVILSARYISFFTALDYTPPPSLTELATEEYCDARYLIDLLHLAYLASDIQKAIISGKIPGNLTLNKLKKRLPVSWSAQRQILGFS